jgi:hypothetical protein
MAENSIEQTPEPAKDEESEAVLALQEAESAEEDVIAHSTNPNSTVSVAACTATPTTAL